MFLELKQLSSSQLTELFGEMESLVAALSETLIAELALRDELEYEKELKNQFISLLLAVQNRRRQHHVTKKRNQMQNGTSPLPQHRSLQEPKVTYTAVSSCAFTQYILHNIAIEFFVYVYTFKKNVILKK